MCSTSASTLFPAPEPVQLLVELLRREYAAKSTFAASLCQQFDRKGCLSDRQVYCARRMVNERTSAPQTREAIVVKLPRIKELFAHAFSAMLKRPRLTFQTSDDTPVVITAAGPDSRNPGYIYVTDGGPYGANRYFGKIDPTGTFTPGRDCFEGIVALLNEIESNPTQAATAYGRKTGRCCFCTKCLTVKKSVEQGYGPVCAKKFGLA